MIDLKKASLLAIASVMLAPAAFADTTPPQDVVKDSHGTIIRNTFNNCVVTQWPAATDECNPQPVKEQPVVKRDIRSRLSKEQRTVYFDFNKSTLNAHEMTKLDEVSHIILESKQVESVDIVGYTDTIGTASYNKKLSERRAETVRNYLAAKGLKTRNVRVEGLGESNLVKDCPKPKKGHKATEKEKACLAEDRRVEIELNVTR